MCLIRKGGAMCGGQGIEIHRGPLHLECEPGRGNYRQREFVLDVRRRNGSRRLLCVTGRRKTRSANCCNEQRFVYGQNYCYRKFGE